MHRLRPTPKVPPNSALTLCGITHRLSPIPRESPYRESGKHMPLSSTPHHPQSISHPPNPRSPPKHRASPQQALPRLRPATILCPPPRSAMPPPHPSIYPIENANEKPPIPPALKPPLRPPHPGVPIYIPQPLRFPLPQPGMCKKVTKISNITLDTNSLISYIMFISWGG